jgi:hypothetical protein
MSKYVRHQPAVSRQADSAIEENHWLKRFQKNLEKSAVQPRQHESSLFDQMNAIMNGKGKHSSVEAAVEDMKERSGLKAYLDKINKVSIDEVSENKKIASLDIAINKGTSADNLPKVIQKCPQIKITLENYINDTKGNLPIPAIIEKIMSIHQNDVSDSKYWDDESLIHLVSQMNLRAKQNNPTTFSGDSSNLGRRDTNNNSDFDPSNVDAFHALNPVKF